MITPLRTWEYLVSKVGTLTLLGLVENTVIVMLLVGLGFNLPPLAASLVLTAALYCLAGVIAVVRYHSINEYLMPSVLYTSLLLTPLLPYLAQWDTWLIYLHPLQATLLLAQSAFHPAPRWQAIYGVLYSTLEISKNCWRRNGENPRYRELSRPCLDLFMIKIQTSRRKLASNPPPKGTQPSR